MLRDQAFERQRRYPFASALDDVLCPICYFHAACLVDVRQIAGVEIATAPELLRTFRTLQISLGQPGSTRDDFACGVAITREVVHGFVHNSQVDQWNRAPCLYP